MSKGCLVNRNGEMVYILSLLYSVLSSTLIIKGNSHRTNEQHKLEILTEATVVFYSCPFLYPVQRFIASIQEVTIFTNAFVTTRQISTHLITLQFRAIRFTLVDV